MRFEDFQDATLRPSYILEQNDFSNSESPSLSNAPD